MIFILFLIVIVGATRMGKTFGCISRLVGEQRKVMALDPQDSLAPQLLSYHVSQGSSKSILYDQIRRTDRAIPFIGLYESNARDPLQRMRENDLERSLIAEPIYGRRSIDGVARPRIAEQTDDALKLIQFQTENSFLYWFRFGFLPQLPDFDRLLECCSHQETVAKFQALKSLSPSALRNEFSATLRLIDPLATDPGFICRCGGTDADDIIKKYDCIIVEGHGGRDQTIELVILWWAYKGIQYVERHKRGLVLVIDEAANWHLITKDILRAVATLEKYGLELVVITQSLSIVPTDVRVTLLQNAHRVECYRVGSMEDARLMAGVFGLPQYDPNAAGGVTGQSKMLMQELFTLPRGVRYVREHGRVIREQSPVLEEGWAWPGISQRMTKEAIERIMQGPDYHTPEYCTPADVRGRHGGSKGGETP